MARVVASQVEAALAQLLADPKAEPQDPTVRHWAAHHHVLPLYEDFGGCLALRPSGEIVAFSWEEPATLTPVNDQHDAVVTHAALGYGSRRYPSVVGIAPERPADAVPCTQCDGTGHIPHVPSKILCACGGLGWYPPDKRG